MAKTSPRYSRQAIQRARKSAIGTSEARFQRMALQQRIQEWGRLSQQVLSLKQEFQRRFSEPSREDLKQEQDAAASTEQKARLRFLERIGPISVQMEALFLLLPVSFRRQVLKAQNAEMEAPLKRAVEQRRVGGRTKRGIVDRTEIGKLEKEEATEEKNATRRARAKSSRKKAKKK